MTDAPAPPTDQGTPPPPEPAPPAGRPPFRRTTGQASVLGGVAGGVARTLGVEPVPVRIVLVLVGVVAPPLLLVYLGTWLLAPQDGAEGRGPFEGRGVAWWLGVTLLAVVSLAALDAFGDGVPLLAVALVGLGIALWNRPEQSAGGSRAGAGTVAPPTSDGDTAGGAPLAWPGGGDAGGPTGPGATPTPDPWTPPPAPPRERSSLGPLTLGLALVAAGVTVALDTAGTIAVDVTQVFAVALAVVGLGLLAGSVLGRARWLALVALVLLPPVLVGSAARGLEEVTDLDLSIVDQLEAGVGERRVELDDVDDLDRIDGLVALGVGELRVDLEDYRADEDADLVIDQGIGELVVHLPADARWRVHARVGAGDLVVTAPDGSRTSTSTEFEIGVPGSTTSGGTTVLTGGPATGPLLDVDVELGLGELRLVETTTEELR